jgi:hypothetical protein
VVSRLPESVDYRIYINPQFISRIEHAAADDAAVCAACF